MFDLSELLRPRRPAHLRPFANFISACAAAILFSTASLQAATPVHATTAEERAVLAPLQALLDGVAQRNHALVRDQLFPGGMATLIRDGQPLQLHFDAFIERLPTTGTAKMEEPIHDPIIHIDDNIAVIWAPYTFTVDGKIDHCGTNIITLIRRNDRWLISGIADNSRKDCVAK